MCVLCVQKISTMKVLQLSRETNTPRVFQLDIGVDAPRFPGREVACSTKVVVTADVSTLTDTISHSTAMTSQSRDVHTAHRKSIDDVTPVAREINWLFIPPIGNVVDGVQTGSGIESDPVRQVFQGEVFPAVRRADKVSESNSGGEIVLENNTLSGQSSTGVAFPVAVASTGNDTQYHNTGTNTQAVSTPPSEEQLRTNHETGIGACDPRRTELRAVVSEAPQTSIPDDEMPAAYQSRTSLDGQEVLPVRGKGNHDNNHVINRKQVPDQLCTYCRRAINEQESSSTKESSLDSAVINSTERRPKDEDSRRGTAEFTLNGNTDFARQESRTATHQDRAVGDDDAFSAVKDCGVGSGTVWTDSRGTGDMIAWTADAETWTTPVTAADRATGTRSVHLVHKNEATDTQWTADAATSPAEDITSVYRGLLAASCARPITVSRGTVTPSAPSTADRQTMTRHSKLVDCGTSPAVDVTAAYRGALDARSSASLRVTVSRGTQTAAPPTNAVDKDTITDCVVVDRASSPVKV